jgi:hypothetical protein
MPWAAGCLKLRSCDAAVAGFGSLRLSWPYWVQVVPLLWEHTPSLERDIVVLNFG